MDSIRTITLPISAIFFLPHPHQCNQFWMAFFCSFLLAFPLLSSDVPSVRGLAYILYILFCSLFPPKTILHHYLYWLLMDLILIDLAESGFKPIDEIIKWKKTLLKSFKQEINQFFGIGVCVCVCVEYVYFVIGSSAAFHCFQYLSNE